MNENVRDGLDRPMGLPDWAAIMGGDVTPEEYVFYGADNLEDRLLNDLADLYGRGGAARADGFSDDELQVVARRLADYLETVVDAKNGDDLFAIITIAEAADITGVSVQNIRASIGRGAIPARKSGGTWLLRRADVVARWGDYS